MPSGAPTRLRRLGHPVVLGAIVVLALNDHVLKARFPGWWTGKLSDVAGVAIVATVTWVVVGRRFEAIGVTAAAFTALKVVPGVAEAAAPVLGGVTRRDPTDLLALAVLVPAAWWLGGDVARSPVTPPVTPPGEARRRHSVPGLAAATAQVLGIVGIVAATTATSCAAPPSVLEVKPDGSDLYALVSRPMNSSIAVWVRSPDHGDHWFDGQPPPGTPSPTAAPRTTGTSPAREVPELPTRGCSPDGTCFRIRDSRTIDRREAGGTWTDDLRATDERESAGFMSCGGRSATHYASLVVADDGTVLVSAGERGVTVRATDGTWRADDSMLRR